MANEMGAHVYVCIRPKPGVPLDSIPRKYHDGWWIEKPEPLHRHAEIMPSPFDAVYLASPADPPVYETNCDGEIAEVWWLRPAERPERAS